MLALWPARHLLPVTFLCPLLAVTAARAADVDACLIAYEAGQRERKHGALLEAEEQLRICSNSECPSSISKDCAQWLAEVEVETPSILVVATAKGEELSEVRVSMDGRVIATTLDDDPIDVNPGTHRFRFEAPGMPAVTRKLEIREGEKERRVKVEFEPSPLPEDPGAGADAERPDHTLAYALAGAGVLGLGSFTYFAIKSHGERSDLDSCKGSCPAEDVDRVRSHQLIADVSLGVGLALVGAAAYLYFSASPAETKKAAGTGFDFTARRGGGTATLWGTF